MSDAKEKTEKADAPVATKKKKSKLIPILLTLSLVVLGGGGAGAYWYFGHRPVQEGAAAEPEPAPPSGIVELEPFVVNLADTGGQRFLRVSMRLLTYTEEQATEMKEDAVSKAKLRSAVLELLSMQLAEPLVTPEGKAELKKAIAERAAHAVHDLKVTDVLFVEFVVQ
ncbi:MAG TPA: flagellar basal body-associated FliL family protein [Vicinamibacterales bacterium]|nr:flagellar basal body-associated FliL family protein [Vicinamibacterales bacterium]